jgi:hypothetical protein
MWQHRHISKTTICFTFYDSGLKSLGEDLPQREQRDIFDFRFKIVDLNKSVLRKFPNLQSTINNLKLHHSVSLWLVTVCIEPWYL